MSENHSPPAPGIRLHQVYSISSHLRYYVASQKPNQSMMHQNNICQYAKRFQFRHSYLENETRHF